MSVLELEDDGRQTTTTGLGRIESGRRNRSRLCGIRVDAPNWGRYADCANGHAEYDAPGSGTRREFQNLPIRLEWRRFR
jgi:hypothetical protein